MVMKKALNVAVAGCGYWGPNLIRNFASLPDCRVKTVCDPSTARLKHMKDLYPGVEGTTDFDSLTSDKEIDAIVVATPVHLHFDLAKRSLSAGKHTFIEKPMAQSSEQCAELVALADKKKLALMVGHTFIYSAPVRRIKQIIDAGDIGEVQYISSRRLNLGLFQKDINVAWDLAPHDISIILYLLDRPPLSVNCQGKAHVNKDIEDVTNMSIDFPNGGFATIHSSWLDPNKVREMVIVGSKRMIVYDDNEPLEKIKIYDKRVETPPHYDTFAEFTYSYHYGDIHIPYIKQTEPLKTETQHFLDCIRKGTRPETSGREGLRVIQILEASSRSLKSGGGKVDIDATLGSTEPAMA
jgi:predicted dehydrogenase